jgi:hypothetical protein
MEKYQIFGKIKSKYNDMTAITNEFVNIFAKCKKIHLRSYYEKKMEDIKPQLYVRRKYDRQSKSDIYDSVTNDLRDEANHRYFSLIGCNDNLVSEFVKCNQDKAFNERIEALSEVENFFESIEDEVAAKKNEKYQQDYNDKRRQQQEFIDGNENIVNPIIKQTFDDATTGIELPFDITVKITYKRNECKAIVEVDIPTKLDIPTQKVNVSATYGKVSLKNKLVRELDDERSKTIIGLAFYISSYVFDITPSIDTVDISIWSDDYTSGLLWIPLNRSNFVNIMTQNVNPLNAVLYVDCICNMKTVRDGHRIESIDGSLFKKRINEKKERIS